MIEIKTAGKSEVPTKIRALVASYQGALATELAVSMPNVLVASTGGQMIPLAVNEHKYTVVETETDLFRLKVALTGTKEEVTERFGFQVDTLVIDSLDEFQRRILVERLRSQKRVDTNYEDWNWISQRLNAIYAGLNELDINVITLTRLTSIDDTSAVKLNIQGAFGTQIHNYVDFAFLLDTGEGEYVDPDIEVDLEENEVIIKSTFIEAYPYLLTKASEKASWVHDDTGLLPGIINVTYSSDWDILFEKLAHIKEMARESSSFIIEDKVEEKDEAKEINVGLVAEATIPGMSSATNVKQLLAERRAKQQEKQQVKV